MTRFLACKSVTMTYRLSLSFVKLHRFLAKLRSLDLVNFSDQTVFRTFFLNACRFELIFFSFLACKPIIMTYGSSWSFLTPHGFFAELRVLHSVNFTDGTVFQTFFYTLADIVLIFGM